MGIQNSNKCIDCGNINITLSDLKIELNILGAENLILIKEIYHEKFYFTI